MQTYVEQQQNRARSSDFSLLVANFKEENELANWFTIMNLHLWLANVRLRYEGYDGGQLQHNLFQRFWDEFTERLDAEVGHPVLVSKYKNTAKERYRGFWVSLDHGILCGDAYLANAIYRFVFTLLRYKLTSRITQKLFRDRNGRDAQCRVNRTFS